MTEIMLSAEYIKPFARRRGRNLGFHTKTRSFAGFSQTGLKVAVSIPTERYCWVTIGHGGTPEMIHDVQHLLVGKSLVLRLCIET